MILPDALEVLCARVVHLLSALDGRLGSSGDRLGGVSTG
jgi:hypothetical protein